MRLRASVCLRVPPCFKTPYGGPTVPNSLKSSELWGPIRCALTVAAETSESLFYSLRPLHLRGGKSLHVLGGEDDLDRLARFGDRAANGPIVGHGLQELLILGAKHVIAVGG